MFRKKKKSLWEQYQERENLKQGINIKKKVNIISIFLKIINFIIRNIFKIIIAIIVAVILTIGATAILNPDVTFTEILDHILRLDFIKSA
jgi:peptidoglycan/LPS O-acetylase OafA/YrhL